MTNRVNHENEKTTLTEMRFVIPQVRMPDAHVQMAFSAEVMKW